MDRTGSFTIYRLEEIDAIVEAIPKQFWGNVLLPIIITRRRDLGGGAYMISGSQANIYLILSSFNQLLQFDSWKLEQSENQIVYKYNLRSIRKKWKTVSVIAFS